MRNDIAEMARDLGRAIELEDYKRMLEIDRLLEAEVRRVVAESPCDWPTLAEYGMQLHQSLCAGHYAEALSYASCLGHQAALLDLQEFNLPSANTIAHEMARQAVADANLWKGAR